eukprot:3631762-Amphidinium_carterae.3
MFAEKRAEAIQIAGQGARVCNHHTSKQVVCGGNPQCSDLWRTPETATLIQKEGVQLLTLVQCMYGL